MKTYKNILVAVLFSSLTTVAFAGHFDRDSCIKERWTLIKEEVTKPAVCIESKKLRLVSGQFNYPNLGLGIMTVRYWEGEVVREVEVAKTYEHTYINVCSGSVTYQEEIKKTYVSWDAFAITNPNLDYSITESFRLAPLTTKEATAAFEKLKPDCIK